MTGFPAHLFLEVAAAEGEGGLGGLHLRSESTSAAASAPDTHCQPLPRPLPVQPRVPQSPEPRTSVPQPPHQTLLCPSNYFSPTGDCRIPATEARHRPWAQRPRPWLGPHAEELRAAALRLQSPQLGGGAPGSPTSGCSALPAQAGAQPGLLRAQAARFSAPGCPSTRRGPLGSPGGATGPRRRFPPLPRPTGVRGPSCGRAPPSLEGVGGAAALQPVPGDPGPP